MGFLRHPEGSQGKQMLIGAVMGAIAFELAAVAGAYTSSGKVFGLWAFLGVFVWAGGCCRLLRAIEAH